MSKNFKFFLIAFLLSLPFWWGVNFFQKNLEDFLFLKKIANQPEILTAEISAQLSIESLKPIRKREIQDFQLQAKSGLSVLFSFSENSEKILLEKEADKILPIASLTKLMTALIVLENYDLSKEIKISKEAVLQEEDFGELKVGEIFSVKQLLYPLLMESSNDAAYALSSQPSAGPLAFVNLMNLKALNLGLRNTYFVNSTGLDSESLLGPRNYSTAKDLIKLTEYLILKQPLIWEVLSTPKFDIYSADGVFRHQFLNTNELLGEIPTIVGGKTGETPSAGGCLLLVSKAPKDRGYLINVILGSNNRFEEMKKLIDWLNLAYKW